MDTNDVFEGTLLGLALGDALGAPFEGGMLERGLWRLIGTTSRGAIRWTDDTQMSLDLAEHLLEFGVIKPDELALKFAASVRWSRGYGPGTARVLRRIRRGHPWHRANRSVFRHGSHGNGAAMRAPVLGLFFDPQDRDRWRKAITHSASITHAHPLAIEGAELIATTVAIARLRPPNGVLLDALRSLSLSEPWAPKLGAIDGWQSRGGSAIETRRLLGNGMSALDSCATAIALALRFRESSFEHLIAFVRELRGDTDTIAAMAGAIWGTLRGAGALPAHQLARLEDFPRIRSTARSLHDAKVGSEAHNMVP